jgi:hypothetical protein
MTTQTEKYHLAMSGEYFVAAQLQRIGIAAAVTYGNAKSADVVAFSKNTDRAVVIEVKSSRRGRWPVGSRVPKPSAQPWVFVLVPETETEAPEFYVLSQKQLHDVLAPIEQEYMAKYEEKHGEVYGDKPGIAAATEVLLDPYLNNWEAIVLQLEGLATTSGLLNDSRRKS